MSGDGAMSGDFFKSRINSSEELNLVEPSADEVKEKEKKRMKLVLLSLSFLTRIGLTCVDGCVKGCE